MQNGNEQALKKVAGNRKRDQILQQNEEQSMHAPWKLMNPGEAQAISDQPSAAHAWRPGVVFCFLFCSPVRRRTMPRRGTVASSGRVGPDSPWTSSTIGDVAEGPTPNSGRGVVETHTVFRPLLILPVVICLSPVWLSVVSVLINVQSSMSVHLIILPTHSRWLKVLC